MLRKQQSVVVMASSLLLLRCVLLAAFDIMKHLQCARQIAHCLFVPGYDNHTNDETVCTSTQNHGLVASDAYATAASLPFRSEHAARPRQRTAAGPIPWV